MAEDSSRSVLFRGVPVQHCIVDALQVIVTTTGNHNERTRYEITRRDWVGVFQEDAKKTSEFVAMAYPKEERTVEGTAWKVVFPSESLPKRPQLSVSYKLWYVDRTNKIRGVSDRFLLIIDSSRQETPPPNELPESAQELVSDSPESSFVTISDSESVSADHIDHHVSSEACVLYEEDHTEHLAPSEGQTSDSRMDLIHDSYSTKGSEQISNLTESMGDFALTQNALMIEPISEAETRLLKKKVKELTATNMKLVEILEEMKSK